MQGLVWWNCEDGVLGVPGVPGVLAAFLVVDEL